MRRVLELALESQRVHAVQQGLHGCKVPESKVDDGRVGDHLGGFAGPVGLDSLFQEGLPFFEFVERTLFVAQGVVAVGQAEEGVSVGEDTTAQVLADVDDGLFEADDRLGVVGNL